MNPRTDSECLLFNNLTFWVNRLAARMRESMNEAFAEFNVTWPQWMVLNVLDSGLAGTPAEVADSIGVDRSAVTRLLDRLADKDFLARIHDDGDRRKVRIELTDAGRELMDALNTKAAEQQRYFLAQLPPTELRTLKGNLQKLLRAGGLETNKVWRQID